MLARQVTSTRRISPWGMPDVIFGLSMIGYAAHQLSLPPSLLPALTIFATLSMPSSLPMRTARGTPVAPAAARAASEAA